jgi:tetratricopeptide (TPR) repeat protein
MGKDNHVKIRSKLQQELSTSFELDGQKYLVMTEDAKPRVITQVYLGGQVVKSAQTDYTAILKTRNLAPKVQNMMEKQHNKTIQDFKQSKLKEAKAARAPERREVKPKSKPVAPKVKPPAEYLSEVKALFAKKNYKSAMVLLEDALEKHPDDAFLLSYSGCLDAVVNKNYSGGIKACKAALKALKKKLPFGQEFYLPTLYLNLGRAHLAAGEKQEAIDAFMKGLKMDPDNKDLVWEMKKLGERKPPPISFLDRTNPINKYIGMMLHKMRK